MLNSTLGGKNLETTLNLEEIKITILDNSSEGQTDTWSFVQVAPKASFEATGARDVYKLTLQDVYEAMYYLGNAPNRASSIHTVRSFMEYWQTRFGDIPPNASVTSYSEDGALQVHLLTLDDPVYDEDTNLVSYSATLLHGNIQDLEELRSPTLFIDSTDECTGAALDPGDGTKDLEITKAYCVEGGTYKYKNVNIHSNGVLHFKDGKTDFWANSILVENEGSLTAGSPDNPIGTGDPANVLTFHLYGDTTDTGITCKTGNCGVSQTDWASHPTAKIKLPGGVSDYFYEYKKLPTDQDLGDGVYFGRKTLAVSYGGTLQMFGKKGATYNASTQMPTTSGTSWARLNQSVKKGDTQLILDRPVDWQKGDMIVVTATDYLPSHSELHTIEAIIIDGQKSTITTSKSVSYAHNGEKYDLSKHNIPSRMGSDFMKAVETRAAVALLSRNIRVVSEGSKPDESFPSDSYFGGHTIVRQGFKSFQMQGVEFYQLGQGGRMAHSPVNFHMARQTPNDTLVQDCSVWDSMTRWYEIRGTKGVTLKRNVGYLSIGHGYFLAEGTETHNQLVANIGIYARPAVEYKGNPRKVPGCIAKKTGHFLANAGDYIHPSVFYIMNGYNDFEDNMAVGAGTCGACYWIVPAMISGLSTEQSWEGYAGIQKITPGTAPLKEFRGNFCSTAQQSLITIDTTGVCMGLSNPTLPDEKGLQPITNPYSDDYEPDLPNHPGLYPTINSGAMLQPNRCDETTDPSCSAATSKLCTKGETENCVVSAIDSYTSSFHWAQQNFAAIWLRTNWFLFTDSALTDVLNGGLTMVSGGSYDQVINQYWGLTRKTVFVGHTQENNPYASNAGPVGPDSPLKCKAGTPASYCLLEDEGVNIPIDNFSVYQRLYNIYDGPVYQDSNAFVNIKTTPVDGCADNGTCEGSPYMYGPAGRGMGIPKAKEGPHKGNCILPNAAIGWKQPNGFYYPPAFHSTNLYFDDVDIRHFVIVPLFKPGTSDADAEKVKTDYCTYPPGDPKLLFADSFTDVDRQTELNDDDGSYSGLKGADPDQAGLTGTIAVNNDQFFWAPRQILECLSEETCFQSPYDHVSAVVFPECAAKGGTGCGDNWGAVCQDRTCYGVPIYRQYLRQNANPAETKGPEQSIRMMGAGISQRSVLLANNGSYYVDTNVSTAKQTTATKNVFEKGKTYNFFLIYAKPATKVTFQLYVGQNFNKDNEVRTVLVGTQKEDGVVLVSPLEFTPGTTWPADWTRTYDSTTGILEVTMDMKDSSFSSDFEKATEESCGPPSFCEWKDGACKAAGGTNPIAYTPTDDICQWSIKASECPSGGCIGFPGWTFPQILLRMTRTTGRTRRHFPLTGRLSG